MASYPSPSGSCTTSVSCGWKGGLTLIVQPVVSFLGHGGEQLRAALLQLARRHHPLVPFLLPQPLVLLLELLVGAGKGVGDGGGGKRHDQDATQDAGQRHHLAGDTERHHVTVAHGGHMVISSFSARWTSGKKRVTATQTKSSSRPNSLMLRCMVSPSVCRPSEWRARRITYRMRKACSSRRIRLSLSR